MWGTSQDVHTICGKYMNNLLYSTGTQLCSIYGVFSSEKCVSIHTIWPYGMDRNICPLSIHQIQNTNIQIIRSELHEMHTKIFLFLFHEGKLCIFIFQNPCGKPLVYSSIYFLASCQNQMKIVCENDRMTMKTVKMNLNWSCVYKAQRFDFMCAIISIVLIFIFIFGLWTVCVISNFCQQNS